MILDTNALSAIADGQSRAAEILAEARLVAIPVIVLGEYRFGIAHSTRRQDYEQWLDQHLGSCRILEVTENTARAYAAVRSELRASGTPIPSNDAWIAALCREHMLPLLSRDQHFDLVNGIRRLTW